MVHFLYSVSRRNEFRKNSLSIHNNQLLWSSPPWWIWLSINKHKINQILYFLTIVDRTKKEKLLLTFNYRFDQAAEMGSSEGVPFSSKALLGDPSSWSTIQFLFRCTSRSKVHLRTIHIPRFWYQLDLFS